MTLSLTLRASVVDLQRQTKRLFRRAAEDLGVSLASIGEGLERSAGLAERWVDERVPHQLPVYALVSTTAIPDPLFDRIVAELKRLRAEQRSDCGLTITPESALGLLLVRAASLVDLLGRSIAGGQVIPLARGDLLKKLAELETQIGKARRAIEAADRRAR